MIAYFMKGGNYMWPLFGCLIVGLAYVIERFISYALASVDIKKFMSELKSALKEEEGIDKGIEYCKSHRSPVARIMETALESYKKVGPKRDIIEESISNSGTNELAFLERGMPVIAAVSTIAPIIGFLGTVSGMIHAFDAIAIAGEVEPTLVATGISEALITTATGLSIAFPMVAFHVFFSTRSNSYTRMMETTATEFVAFLLEEKP